MDCDFWLVDFDRFGEFLCVKVRWLWLAATKNAIVKVAFEL